MENEKERAKRPRLGQIIKDELMFDGVAFMQNKSSQNARKSHTIENKLHFDMWMDKHYQIRYQHGDEFGKREGIDPDRVLALVEKSLKHLIIYSTKISEVFLNARRTSLLSPLVVALTIAARSIY